MISNEAKEKAEQLVRDIFLQLKNQNVHREVREDPSTYLLSLLNDIKEEISGDRKYRVTLYSIVEGASFDSHLQKAKKSTEPVS